MTLPPSLFLAQENIREICTQAQFEADRCPASSIAGVATAETPLLEAPMQGPVYLRSSDNPLPDLAAVLRGRGVRIVLSKFTMTIFGGRKLEVADWQIPRSEHAAPSPSPADRR